MMSQYLASRFATNPGVVDPGEVCGQLGCTDPRSLLLLAARSGMQHRSKHVCFYVISHDAQ